MRIRNPTSDAITNILPIKYKGILYESIAQLSRAIDIPSSTLRKRINDNPNISVKDLCSYINVHSKTTYEYKGTIYKTLRELGDKVGINQATLYMRLKSGMTIEEACDTKVASAKRITIEGYTFSSMREACKYYNVDIATASARLERGWSVEEAFALVKRENSSSCTGKVYMIENTVNNKKYVGLTTRTLNQRLSQHISSANKGSNTKFHKAMRKIGISKFTIRLIKETNDRHDLRQHEIKYIKKYDTIAKGYNTAVGGGSLGDRFGNPIEYDGVKFNSVVALSEYLGISIHVVHRRLKNNIDLSLPVRKSRIILTFKNKKFKSKKSLTDFLGMSLDGLQYRLDNDIPLDQPVRKSKLRPVKYRNKIYRDCAVLARHLGISRPTVCWRLRRGYCLNGPPKMTGTRGYYTGEYVDV